MKEVWLVLTLDPDTFVLEIKAFEAKESAYENLYSRIMSFFQVMKADVMSNSYFSDYQRIYNLILQNKEVEVGKEFNKWIRASLPVTDQILFSVHKEEVIPVKAAEQLVSKEQTTCKFCGRNVFVDDKNCWWCTTLNPGKK